jgi:hypothetical protein
VSNPIDLRLFDFIEEFAIEVQKGNVDLGETVATDSPILTFCKSFFEQFFAATLDYQISRLFDYTAREEAAELAVRLRLENKGNTTHMRAIISLFESFCVTYSDDGGLYGDGPVSYRKFYNDYMKRLLRRAREWAEAEGIDALAERIAYVGEFYDRAMKSQKWLSKTKTKSGSVLRRLIWRKRTIS